MVHCMYHILNVQLQAEIASKISEETSLGTETTILLSMLTVSESKTLREKLISFNKTLARKWESTCERNLCPEVCGSDGLWKKAIVLDPFLKVNQSQSFGSYITMFEIVTDTPTDLEAEFNTYMCEPIPDNLEIEILTFWKSKVAQYPRLSRAALQLLCLPNGSADVERSFSKLRKLQDPSCSSMSEHTLNMQMTLFVNQDLENHFFGY